MAETANASPDTEKEELMCNYIGNSQRKFKSIPLLLDFVSSGSRYHDFKR